jgi:molybdopterin molybdotransferase
MISYKRSQQILKKAPIKIGDEIINCENALNRVLSLNIFSNYNYPAANNAAFDGFAVNSKDTKFLNKNSPQKFRIIGSMIAGTKPITKKIKKFETIEIMTVELFLRDLILLFQLSKFSFIQIKTIQNI